MSSSLQEQLNHVPWEQLSYPHREASEIPTHLLTLLSPDDEAWQSAFDQLEESLCTYEQCLSITEASCAAVPFLIVLLQEVPDQRKCSLLRLLSELAGQPTSAHRERMVLKMDHHGQETRQCWQPMEQFSQEGNAYYDAQWTERAHQLVGAGLPSYLSLLHSAHEDTVRGALELLGRFQDLSEVLVPVVIQFSTEAASSLLKVLAFHCLSDLLDPHAPEWEIYHQAVTTPDVHPMVRSVAARELALVMSPRTFARHFQATLGTTPYQWLLQQRIVLAQRQLETTNETIERVATCCGFSSAATLRLHFQRLLHISPQMYRHAFHRENRGETATRTE